MNLINRTNVKKLALEYSTKHRSGKFTRVSKSFLDAVEYKVLGIVMDSVRFHPTVGKTIDQVR